MIACQWFFYYNVYMIKKTSRKKAPKAEKIAESSVTKEPGTGLKNEEKKSLLYEIVKTVLTIAFIFVAVRYFIVQPFLVVGSSMEPNFHEGQYLFVNELTYRVKAPARGDVIVFKHPDETCTAHVDSSFINRIFIQGPCRNYIKRIVGLPGERISVENGKIKIVNNKTPEGFFLDEKDYVPSNLKLFGNQTVDIDKKEYYVIGDNREPNGSSDSREWGVLPKSHITGKAWLTIAPISDFGFLPKIEY